MYRNERASPNMAFPTPRYSRSHVNRAGELLITRPIEDVKSFLMAHAVVSNWRSCHSYPINTFKITLRKKCSDVCDNYIVAQRLKRMESITEKLRRYPNMKLSTMQDIGGLRAVVQTAEQAARLRDMYVGMSTPVFAHELVSQKDYLAEPKSSGYRGIHLVYRYRNKLAQEYDGLQIELQLRSKIQHLWATAVETVGTFLSHSLKSSQGPADWLDFFALTGSAFSHLENLPPVPQYSDLTKADTFDGVIERATSLRVREHLEGYTAVAEHIQTSGKRHAYHLIVLNPISRSVEVTPFSRNRLTEATEMYAGVEKRISEGASLQAVLVSAGSILDLKKAYPNYFLDTHEFIAQLDSLAMYT